MSMRESSYPINEDGFVIIDSPENGKADKEDAEDDFEIIDDIEGEILKKKIHDNKPLNKGLTLFGKGATVYGILHKDGSYQEFKEDTLNKLKRIICLDIKVKGEKFVSEWVQKYLNGKYLANAVLESGLDYFISYLLKQGFYSDVIKFYLLEAFRAFRIEKTESSGFSKT